MRSWKIFFVLAAVILAPRSSDALWIGVEFLDPGQGDGPIVDGADVTLLVSVVPPLTATRVLGHLNVYDITGPEVRLRHGESLPVSGPEIWSGPITIEADDYGRPGRYRVVVRVEVETQYGSEFHQAANFYFHVEGAGARAEIGGGSDARSSADTVPRRHECIDWGRVKARYR